jgi:hypothetical protein
MTKVGRYALGTSTPLEANKSHRLSPGRSAHGGYP